MKHEEFKKFIKTKPELISYVKSGEMSWQKFYEIYDLYGENSDVWNKYVLGNRESAFDSINKITNMVKNVDVNSIKSHVNAAQKAIDFMQDLTKKESPINAINSLNKGPVSPRPLNKFFED